MPGLKESGGEIGVPNAMILESWNFPAATDWVDMHLLRLPFPARLVHASAMAAAVGTTGTFNLMKLASGTAPDSGTSVLVGGTAINLSALATNLIQILALTASTAANPHGVNGELLFAAGDILSLSCGGSPLTVAGAFITVHFIPFPGVRREFDAGL